MSAGVTGKQNTVKGGGEEVDAFFYISCNVVI
jgi:hypothetical protein